MLELHFQKCWGKRHCKLMGFAYHAVLVAFANLKAAKANLCPRGRWHKRPPLECRRGRTSFPQFNASSFLIND
jgi:hypothetical protein